MTEGNDQTEFKNIVKQWLKSHGLDYRWMAERCGVSEITVRNWMSQKNIPILKQQLIERVMVQLPGPDEAVGQTVPGVSVNTSMSLTVQLAPDMYRRLTERALAAGLTPEALVAQAIADLVKPAGCETATQGLKTREVILPTFE
ncbi:MAG: hypothetical protein IKZ10_06750 [Akkermansia sp.]|nr:hypothetical protein [Akkermansia sp.]